MGERSSFPGPFPKGLVAAAGVDLAQVKHDAHDACCGLYRSRFANMLHKCIACGVVAFCLLLQ